MNAERFRKNFLSFIFIGLFIGWCFEEVVPHVVYEWYYRTLFVFALLLPCIMNTDECGDIVFNFLKTCAMKSYFFLNKIRADYKNILQKIKINLIIFFFLIIQPIISLWIMIEVYFYAKIYEKKTDSYRGKTDALEKNCPNLRARRYTTYKMILLNLILLLMFFFKIILYMLILRQKFSFFHKQITVKKMQTLSPFFVRKEIDNIFFIFLKNFALPFFNQINLYNIHNLIKQHFNRKILKKTISTLILKLQKNATKKILLWPALLKNNKNTFLNIEKKKIKVLKQKNKYTFFIQKIKKKLNFIKKFPKYIFKIKQRIIPFAKNSKKILKYFFETLRYKKKYKTKQPLIRIKYGRILFGKKKIESDQDDPNFLPPENLRNSEIFITMMPLLNFLEVNKTAYIGKKSVPIHTLSVKKLYKYIAVQNHLLKKARTGIHLRSLLEILKFFCTPFRKKKVETLVSFLERVIAYDVNTYNAIKKTHSVYAPAYMRTKRYQKFLKYHHLTEHKRLNTFKPQMLGDTIIAKKNRGWHALVQNQFFEVEKFLLRKKSNKKIENILFKKKTDLKNKYGYFFLAKHHNNRVYTRKYYKSFRLLKKKKTNLNFYKRTFFKQLLKEPDLTDQEIPFEKDDKEKKIANISSIPTGIPVPVQKHIFFFKKKRKKNIQWNPLKKKKNFLSTLIKSKKKRSFFDLFFYYYSNWKKFITNEQKNYYSKSPHTWTKNLIFKKFLKQYALLFIPPTFNLKKKTSSFLKILKKPIKTRIKKNIKLNFHKFMSRIQALSNKFLILIKNKKNKITKFITLKVSKFFKVKIIKKFFNFLKKIRNFALLFAKTIKNTKKTFTTFYKKHIFPQYTQQITERTKTLVIFILQTAFTHKRYVYKEDLSLVNKMLCMKKKIVRDGTNFKSKLFTEEHEKESKKKFLTLLKKAILTFKMNNLSQFKKNPTRNILNQLFLNTDSEKIKKKLKIFKKIRLLKFKKYILQKYSAQNRLLKKKMKFFRKRFLKKKKKKKINKSVRQYAFRLNTILNVNNNKKTCILRIAAKKKKKKKFFNIIPIKGIKKYKKKKFIHFKSFHNFIKNQFEFFTNALTKKTKYFLINIIKNVTNKQNQFLLNYNIYSKFNIALIPIFNKIQNKIFKINALHFWFLKKPMPVLLQTRKSKKKIQKKPNKKILKHLKKNIQKFYNYEQYKNKKKVLMSFFKHQLNNFSTPTVLKKLNVLTFKNKIFFLLSNIFNFIEKTKLHLNYKKYFKQNITFFEENFIVKIIQQNYNICFKEKIYTTLSKFQKQFYSSVVQKNQFLKKYYNNLFKKNYYKTTLAQYEDFHYLKQSTLVIQNLLNFYTIFIRILPLPTATSYTTIELKSKKKRFRQINTLRVVRRAIITMLNENIENTEKTISLKKILRNVENDIERRMKPIVPEDVEKLTLLIKQVKIWKKTIVSHILNTFLKFDVRFNFFKKNFKPLIAINVWKNYVLNTREPFHDILFNNPKKFRKYRSSIAKRYQKNPFYGYQLNFAKENISNFFPPILTYFKKKFKIDTKSRKNLKQILQNTLLPIFTKVPHLKKKLFSNMYDIRDNQAICFNIFENSIRVFLFKIKFFTTFTLIDFFLHKGIIFYNLNFSNPIINPYTFIPDNTLISFNPKITQYTTLLYNFKQFIKLYKFPKKIYILKNFLYKKYLFYKTKTSLKFFFEPHEYFLPNTEKKNKLNNFFFKNWNGFKKKEIKIQKKQKKKIKTLNSRILPRSKRHRKFKRKVKIQKMYNLNKRIQQKRKGFLFYFPGKHKYKGFCRNNSIKIFKKLKFFKNSFFLKESDKIFVEMPLIILQNLGQFAFIKKTKKKLKKIFKQNFLKKILFKKIKFNVKKNVFKQKPKNTFKYKMFLQIKSYFPIKNFFFLKKKNLKTFLIHLKKIQNIFFFKKKLKQNQTKILIDFWTEEHIEFLQMGYSNFF